MMSATKTTKTARGRSPRSPAVPEAPRARSWGEMTTHERTARLVPLLGREVKYVRTEELRSGLAAFGPAFPRPWRRARLDALVPVDGAPAVRLAVPPDDSFLALSGAPEVVMLPFVDIADLRAARPPWADDDNDGDPAAGEDDDGDLDAALGDGDDLDDLDDLGRDDGGDRDDLDADGWGDDG